MSLTPRHIPPVPEETAAVANAAFPKGNVYLYIRDEFGSIYTDDVFADLYPKDGQPAVRPWRLALVTVMQFAENLSDRQAADAVRARIDWKYALSLELTDAGFNYSVLSEFRKRLIENEGAQRLLDNLLTQLREKGLLKRRGQQRTDSTHVLAAVRELNRLENIGETLRNALNGLAILAPEWVQAQVPPEWFERYGPRFEQYRFPKSKKEQEALAIQVGQDGYALLSAIYAEEKFWLRDVPAVEILRQVWVQQFWCNDGEMQLRDAKDTPPAHLAIRSPFDVEARYCTKRQSGWVGYKVHFTETCDEDQPRLITHVETTTATLQDSKAINLIQDDLAAIDLLPDEHLVDAGYVNGPQLVYSQQNHDIALIGPAPQDTSWQARSENGLTATEFNVDWGARQVICPTGHSSIIWQPAHSSRGQPVIRVHFDPEACQACNQREECTRGRARSLTLRPREQHEALQDARQYEQSEEFRVKYRKRAGVEGTISQATRVTGLRRTRYVGLDKAHLQNLASAAALNLARVVNWANDIPCAATRCSPFAALAA